MTDSRCHPLNGAVQTYLRVIVFSCLSALIGCGSWASGDDAKSILTLSLEHAGVVAKVKEAEQDLVGDMWVTGPASRPGRYNRSRQAREYAVARDVLEGLKPQLEKMSPRDLLRCLKTHPYAKPESYRGVAYFVYRDGNQAIIDVLKARPRKDLESLRASGADDSLEIFTGDNGPPLTVGVLVRHTLLGESQGRDN